MVHLSGALGQLCIPLAGRRITKLRTNGDAPETDDEIMIELELCIGLIFKPLRHHVQNIVHEGTDALMALWKPTLEVLKMVLNEQKTVSDGLSENGPDDTNKLIDSCHELALEHLRNVIMVLIDYGVLHPEPLQQGDISDLTWTAVAEIECCKIYLEEWKQAAKK